jgi:hypothetical protein
MLEWVEGFFSEITITDVLLAIFTGLLWWSTHRLWQSTHTLSKAALEQAKDMKSSVAESARAATAMEKVAEAIAISAAAATKSVGTSEEIAAQQKLLGRLQMRAYLSVVIGGATYQDDKGLFFASRPVLVNNGHTPAYKISYWARADIVPWPLPPEFAFPPSGQATSYAAVLAPGHNFTLNARVSQYVNDTDVENVKRGTGIPAKRLCIWGQVTYEDVFGETHFTNFCHGTIWLKGADGNELIYGHYAERHNDSNRT